MAKEFKTLKNGITLTEKNRYFSLKSPETDIWDVLKFIVKIPFSLPRWIGSFFFAHIITFFALNPGDAKQQRTTHLVNLNNSIEEPDAIVVVNVLPQESYKTLKNYLLKFNNTFFNLPFMDEIKERQLSWNNAVDRQRIDDVLLEVDALLAGTSTDDKCKEKKFSGDQLYFKGLESLDEDLLHYFNEELRKRDPSLNVRNIKTKVNLEFFTLKTTEGSILDCVETSVESEHIKPIHERKFVISCLPKQQNYINYIKDSRLSAQKIGATIIGFNYRGLDYSKGLVWTHNNMVDDVISQVERLLAMGVPPQNIGLEGTSLGGATATVAAARLHKLGYGVKLYNERSFRDLPRFLSGLVLPEADASLLNPLTILRYIAAFAVFLVSVPGFWLTDWTVDAAGAWQEIPAEDKCYSVVRKAADPEAGEPEVVDGMVHDTWASIASLIDEQRVVAVKKKEDGQALTDEESAILSEDNPEHNYFITKAGQPEYLSEEAAALARQYPSKTPHFYARHKLVDDNGKTMHDYMTDKFVNFFKDRNPNPRSLPLNGHDLHDVRPL